MWKLSIEEGEKDMNIKDLQKNWDKLGKRDPFRAILTRPEKKGNKWDTDEFFATGKREIDLVMKHIKSLGLDIPRRKALDFGCGVGRLTKPLADYFDEVYGVDIAPSMIELANKYNQCDKCKYYLNEANDLKLFSDYSFDFIYTSFTLQHMEPQYSKNYMKEFLRILVPDGLLIFQLPSKKKATSTITKKQTIKKIIPRIILNVYCKVKYGGVMEGYGMKREDVVEFLRQNGAKVADIQTCPPAIGSTGNWVNFRYCVTKK